MRRQADEDLGRPEPLTAREQAGPYCDKPDCFTVGSHVHEPPPFIASADHLLITHVPNPETEALSRCADSLDLLDPEACKRVLRYLTDRYSPKGET